MATTDTYIFQDQYFGQYYWPVDYYYWPFGLTPSFVTYTGTIDLVVLARDFTLDVQDRDYGGLRVLKRDFTLDVEDR